ncbi:hypothetical protein BO94DRAFT_585312 [Aspergillus sclerotioniger CBS 115572]|uniref:Uncharacterized protein n=1 Tax=Aspergillus sclerotioniger CBS 115572 TaxID=1450535 RepID=A0A317WN38_9EURO|nr:hypothetical protein BO94DRAFT_585312 [Aspergillus sclerotioniger CBS 115572]PWY87829.1 hypothetical protein BO94DRAFT_585312 [Aspergillus sclerotioniger CBS 115572]
MTSMAEISWPPKSPREALLSTPNGRKRYEDMQRRRENLGSPLKRSLTTPDLRSKASQLLSDGVDDGEEDEDEETLQLKLAAIEARLKLKQLQKSRAKTGTPGPDRHDGDASSRPASMIGSSQAHDQLMGNKNEYRTSTDACVDDVQVPLSPTRRPAPPTDPVSPRRYVLGIDKGLRSRDVSLRRPPSSKGAGQPAGRPGTRDGLVSHSGNLLQAITVGERSRPKSFSERMAESRSIEVSRRERAARVEQIQANRSSAFQIDKAEVEAFKAAAEARKDAPKSPTRTRRTESFSREDVLRSYNNLKPSLKRSQSQITPGVRRHDDENELKESRPYFHRRNQKSESEVPGSSQHSATDDSQGEKSGDPSKFEAFSSLHLSNRILPHSFLTRTLEDKKALKIPDLLRTVKAPDFELPEDIDTDFVVFGIVASKSEPRQIKQPGNTTKKEVDPFDDGTNNNSQYMVITLTDLKWTIDLFLFDTAFPRYYRISEGILIAILNPTIMPPPKNKTDTNKFSLAISSSDDKVLEVGYAQDIGFCKAVRKDGKTCHSWVDGRKTEFCDFHVDLQIRRTQAHRMGVNGGTGMYGPGGRSGSRTGFFSGDKKGRPQNGLKPVGARYDFQSQSTYYVAPAPKSRGSGPSFHQLPSGQSAASLIDADNEDPFIAAGMMGRGMESKEERFRKRLAEKQRERDITHRLISRPGGVGAEYLRSRDTENVSSPRLDAKSEQAKDQKGAADSLPAHNLGVSSFRRADTVKLSPLKRAHDGDRPRSSSIKKTRFITSHGIKEAGRDSLGGKSDMVPTNNDDDDDDELDII